MDFAKKYLPYAFSLSIVIPLITLVITLSQDYIQSSQQLAQMIVPKDPSQPVDVLIIGGGPAGLSAATTLYRHQHDVRIFDNEKPRNSWDTETHALPTWEGKQPSKFLKESRRELSKTGLVDFISAEVKNIEQREDGFFQATTSNGENWVGRKVLLAMGVQFQVLDVPGYTDCFPKRILHCLFTFGFEHRGSFSAGIIAVGFAGSPFHANILVDDARKFSEKVTVYTNSDKALASEIQKVASYNDTIYDARQIVSFTKKVNSVLIEFDDGDTKEESFIIHQPGTRVNPSFVQQLGLELNERGDVITKMPFYQTNVPGVFAAGDCASPFKMISNALLMGANAGAGIARELPTRITGHAINRFA